MLILFLVLTGKWKPFSTSGLNDMELLSLITSMLSIYCGLYFIADISESEDSETSSNSQNHVYLTTSSKVFFFFVILMSNLVFFTYWAAMMAMELKN
jgi:hypothetical protein